MPRKKNIYKDLDELKKTIESASGAYKEIANSLFVEISFLKETLENLKKQIATDGEILVTQRGTQKIIKEHPAVKSYNTSIQRYSLLYKQITDLLPKPEEKPPSNPLLDFIKEGQTQT